jgi:S1-C subfamily serine protease
MVDGEAVIRVIKMEFDYDKKDLAILEVKSGCPCVPLGDLPKVDGEVALIGFPYSTGFQGLQVQVLTLGRLQGYSPGLDRIVTTSPAAPGNSGGGLFTHKDGQWFLIGILVQGAGIGGPTHLSLSVPYKTIVEFLKGPLD